MCGIAGIWGPEPFEEIQNAAWRMVRAQAHRGPDDEGVATVEAGEPGRFLSLGCSRLAVIDLSAQGHQPMQNEDGSVHITYNGEIYNFGSLRRHLESKGYRFKSRTDTEVILHLYQEYGEKSFAQLNGMFAVAIWDQRQSSLLLARDRMGEKPLYFTWSGQRFLFASEIKGLLASGLVPKRVDPAAVAGFLTLGSVPSPLTILQGVQCLESGCFLRLKAGTTSTTRYWELSFDEDSNLGGPDISQVFQEHLLEATQSRLVSDVPVGVFLSGGLDSSAIVSQVREKITGKLRTFSIRFEDSRFDEGPFAQLVAQRFETDHDEHVITADEILKDLNPFLKAMDQPSIDGLNTYFVSKYTRASGVVVALSGLGGDELLGGYSSFRLVPKLCRLGGFLDHFYVGRRALAASIGLLSMNGRVEKLQGFLNQNSSPESAYLAVKSHIPHRSTERLLAPDIRHAAQSWDPMTYVKSIAGEHNDSLGNIVSRLELGTYLQNQLLRDSDNMSMAHSLEVRAPFLDNNLVQFLCRVPAARKFGGKPKSLLIDAMKDTLPSQIIERPKMGFSFPIDGWLKLQWKELAEDILFTEVPGSTKIFDQVGLRELWQSFLANQVRWSRVWAALILKIWVSINIDGVSEPVRSTAGHH